MSNQQQEEQANAQSWGALVPPAIPPPIPLPARSFCEWSDVKKFVSSEKGHILTLICPNGLCNREVPMYNKIIIFLLSSHCSLLWMPSSTMYKLYTYWIFWSIRLLCLLHTPITLRENMIGHWTIKLTIIIMNNLVADSI